MVESHWSNLLSSYPKLENIDINLKQEFVKTSPDDMWNPKTSIKAIHVYSDTRKEKICVQIIYSLYNKH